MSINESIAKEIVKELLDIGLYNSDWREAYPVAYGDLLDYREDIEASVVKVLNRNEDLI